MAAIAQEESSRKERRIGGRTLNDRVEKSLPVPEVEPLRVVQRCSRLVFYRSAIFGIARYDESGCLACGRKRLPPQVRVAAAPRIGPGRASLGSGHPACA